MAETHDKPATAGDARPGAVLLLGPTGSGKTPLGDALQACGLWGRACVHFDFGRVLRSCVRGDGAWGLPPDQCTLLARMLETGALLEDEHFPVAERLFQAFLTQHRVGPAVRVVLNGLPRHVGQAAHMTPLVRMEAVVHLVCARETVLARLRRDAGGDRAARKDDDLPRVRRRLALYRQRTEPLVAHYRAREVRVVPLAVGPETTAEAMLGELEARGPA